MGIHEGVFTNHRWLHHEQCHVCLYAETSAVFLAPSCFVRPFEHLVEQETKRSVQSYLAFLKDDTRLITNPGLKVHIIMVIQASFFAMLT